MFLNVYCRRLGAKVPYQRLSDFVGGVLIPLQRDGAQVDVEVVVKARAESDGIKEKTLNTSVKETLAQIGAEVKEETCA